MKKGVIILMGPPGAGKGTQANIIAKKYGFFHLESSKVIEEQFRSHKDDEEFVVDGKTFTYGLFKKQWLDGELVETTVVSYWVSEEIKRYALDGKSLVFSGSPRTVLEAEKQIPLQKELYGKENIFVVMLEVPEETSVYRNSNRRICKDCRTPIPFNEETKDLTECSECGGGLIKRELDDPDVIRVRLKEYEERTLPIVEYMKNEGLRVHVVDGSGSIKGVSERIEKEFTL